MIWLAACLTGWHKWEFSESHDLSASHSFSQSYASKSASQAHKVSLAGWPVSQSVSQPALFACLPSCHSGELFYQPVDQLFNGVILTNFFQIFSVILVIHLIVHLLACSINPADDEVLRKIQHGNKEVATFDRSAHRHVIENFHCYICQVDVSVVICTQVLSCFIYLVLRIVTV